MYNNNFENFQLVEDKISCALKANHLANILQDNYPEYLDIEP